MGAKTYLESLIIGQELTDIPVQTSELKLLLLLLNKEAA